MNALTAFKRMLAAVLTVTMAGSLSVRAALAQAPKQAVVETTAGAFVIDLTPEQAPATAAYFMKIAGAGGYDGTTFHRMVRLGLVQGGDPISKDPARRAQYGTGGLNVLKDEGRAAKMTRGSVAAVTIPGKANSAGQQFFVAVVDQPGLDGKYTVFGHVSDGIEVVQKISETPVDDKGAATERVEITRVSIRDTPPEPSPTTQHRILPRIAPSSRRARGRSRSHSCLTRRPRTSGNSCGWRRPACSIARPFTESSRDS
jgi:cyclophilin family peptidyl-prolyl cis-trans isomerase